MKTLPPLNVGVLGVGTVGAGTVNLLQSNSKQIERRLGRSLVVTAVASRNPKKLQADVSEIDLLSDLWQLVNSDVDIVVELIGGCDPARELVLQAIANGKHVVTANKALIALHGEEIFAAAKQQGVQVAYEASVAGGIPIIKSIREGLAANHIEWIAGIVNGTSNFILTQMRDHGRSFNDALQEAQALGYAEADPSFDVGGIDAAHKMTILNALAFGAPLQFDACHIEGIEHIELEDVQYAQELGYRIKPLGITRYSDEGMELRVHPTLIPEDHLLAHVDGVMNAVVVQADAAGQTLYCGAGAGAMPTASAVVADIINIARSIEQGATTQIPGLGFQSPPSTLPGVISIDQIKTAYYLRMHVKDQPGVMAKVTAAFAEHNISIEACVQKEATLNSENQAISPLFMTTHCISATEFNRLLATLNLFDEITRQVMYIRIDPLQ